LRHFLAAFALFASIAIEAQTSYLLKDINSTTLANPSSSSPSNFFRFGSRVFFSATATGGTELWATDGTAAGTAQVADIYPGGSSSPSRFVNVNGKLLFNARDSHGEELWTSDGTAAGTRLLADISLGSSSPSDRIVYHDKMLFAADDGIDGRELWITDGTPAGTRFFKDLTPGPNSSDPNSFVIFNDAIYFVAGNMLWKSDGTESGTVVLKADVLPSRLSVAGSQLFFTGYTANTGYAPWVTDGTAAGTRMIAPLAPIAKSPLIYIMNSFGDRALFVATDADNGFELWITDGTAAGTHIVREINAGSAPSVEPNPIAIAGGTAYFTAFNQAMGTELWKTDGTEAGTVLVKDIVPGGGSSSPRGLVAIGNNVFFVANIDGKGTLWVSDGTDSGTHQVTTGNGKPTVTAVNGIYLTNIDGTVYFAGANSLNGAEPWKSDGTNAGTTMIANLARDFTPSSNPRNFVAAGDWVYFDAWDGNEAGARSTWRSDGTPEGTLKVADCPLSGGVASGRSLFFTNTLDGSALWKSDGTPETTGPAKEFASRFPSSPNILFVNGDTLFVSAGELCTTTAAANAPVVRLGLYSAHSFVNIAGRTMFFAQASSIGEWSLWITDGTLAGTQLVGPSLGDGYLADEMVVMGGQVFLSTIGVAKLRKSDGTFDGTTVIKESGAGSLTAAGRKLFFLSNGQLWVTDGTPAGTRALPATAEGKLAAVGGRVVFASRDDANGEELWVSDGTDSGTHLLSDIYPGPNDSQPWQFIAVDGLVYFAAFDKDRGQELFTTDGTPEGTKLAVDIEPGFLSSDPESLVRAGERLFFSANTQATGYEPWALQFPSTPRLSIGDTRVTEGNGTVARFTVTLSAPSSKSVTVAYATSDGTALAGSDYDALSGTLTFAAGETTKSIDVPVRADTVAENNETFFVTLSNPAGATLAKPSAFAIIDDDDQLADIALSLDFSQFKDSGVIVNATNNGPRSVLTMNVQSTATEAFLAPPCNNGCPLTPGILPGATAKVFSYVQNVNLEYISVTATTSPRDPDLSNNSIGWITNGSIALDALYLNPGSQANVWFRTSQTLSSVSVESSNPGVISVPATVAVTDISKPVSFPVHANAVGSATIRIFSAPGTLLPFTVPLTVDVVAPGTKPRWPGAFTSSAGPSNPRFDQRESVVIGSTSAAPFSGARATGLVTVTSDGQEVARMTLPGTAVNQTLSFYLPSLGTHAVVLNYAGDSSFLPLTNSWSINSTIGFVSITATPPDRAGTTLTMHINVTGSPVARPTGTITITEPGVVPSKQATLSAAEAGVAHADLALTNVATGQHTFVVSYSGDSHYSPSTQNIRITDGRRHSVGH
jgi:ELWxxDGT repeat protein